MADFEAAAAVVEAGVDVGVVTSVGAVVVRGIYREKAVAMAMLAASCAPIRDILALYSCKDGIAIDLIAVTAQLLRARFVFCL